MSDPRAPIFAFMRRLKGNGLTQGEVDKGNRLLDDVGARRSSSEPVLARRGAQATLAAVVGATAASGLFLSVPQDEGTEYRAYRDIAGIWTICQGDTKNVRPGMVETPEGCRERLERQGIRQGVGDDRTGRAVEPESRRLDDSLLVDGQIGSQPHPTVMPRRLGVPLPQEL